MAVALAIGCTAALAQNRAAAPVASNVNNSALDGETFYQLFLSELEVRQGEPAVAYQVMLEAARRTRDEQLFRRAVEMAIGARAPEQALAALKQWRQALPRSRSAPETQAQVLMALGRPQDAVEPMRATVELTTASDRPRQIAALAGLVPRGDRSKPAATALDEALRPWKDQSATRASVLLASSRAWLAAADTNRALSLAIDAQKLDPGADTAALVGLELFGQDPRAEALVRSYVASASPNAAIRLVHVRRLTAAQRYREALDSARAIVDREPAYAPAWLTLGALQIEVGSPEDARRSLERFLDLDGNANPSGDEPEGGEGSEQERSQAMLMLAQASEQLKDFEGAQRWLERLGADQNSSSVVLRRASLLARQGRLDEARTLVRTLPERNAEERRAKVMGETQLLRESRRWTDAYDVLVEARKTLPDDPDLLYEQALLAEKLRRFDEMEQLLRRVIELKPDQQHAYNALGYSLADRGERLVEARELVSKALELSPGDPFITDSLGWIEFRLGRRQEALQLLQRAYDQRPDVEIGAHLGEVLWSLGRLDDAREVWRASQERDAGNEVLSETLVRLKVRL